MSLYTKHRPHRFEDVIGQDEAVNFFKSIIEKSATNQDIPHAYLLAGTHGIGKTTIARIFSRELGVSESDIYELDAASSSKKIEDMRDMIDSTYTLPINSKYKVYILDEAHMLTKDSANAFLKTLEEPSNHCIFILCTTDDHKIIPTIKSRCNVVKLKSPNSESIVSNLKRVVEREEVDGNIKFNLSDEVLNLIANHSNNSFRDSITNLERVLNTLKTFDYREVEEIFGRSDVEVYSELINLIKEKSNENNQAIEKLINFINLNYLNIKINKLIHYIRLGMLARNKININEGYGLTLKEFEVINKLTSDCPGFFISANLLYFLQQEDLYTNANDKSAALMAILGNFIEK